MNSWLKSCGPVSQISSPGLKRKLLRIIWWWKETQSCRWVGSLGTLIKGDTFLLCILMTKAAGSLKALFSQMMFCDFYVIDATFRDPFQNGFIQSLQKFRIHVFRPFSPFYSHDDKQICLTYMVYGYFFYIQHSHCAKAMLLSKSKDLGSYSKDLASHVQLIAKAYRYPIFLLSPWKYS